MILNFWANPDYAHHLLTVKQFEDLGVDRLILLPKGRRGPMEKALQFIEETAEHLNEVLTPD